MSRPASQDLGESTKLIGFQATEEFRLRLKVAAARRGKSMKDALHEAVELWIASTEDEALYGDAPTARDPVTGLFHGINSKDLSLDPVEHLQTEAIEDESEDFDEVEDLFGDDDDEDDVELDSDIVDEELTHGSSLIVETPSNTDSN